MEGVLDGISLSRMQNNRLSETPSIRFPFADMQASTIVRFTSSKFNPLERPLHVLP